MTLQTSNKAQDETRQYIDTTLSVVKDTCQDETTLQPHHTQDPSPHPSPSTPNLEVTLLDPLDCQGHSTLVLSICLKTL